MPLFSTVAQAVAEVGTRFPESGYVFQDMKGEEVNYAYSKVEELTAQRAAALQQLGLEKGDRIGLIVIEPEDFVLTFLAAIRIGVVPVPMYPPMSFGALDAYAERSARVLRLSETKVLFASAKIQNILWSLVDEVDTLEKLVPVEDLRKTEGLGAPTYPEILPEDVAFLQYTSGSTSDPKGVIVTHASLVANCHAIIFEGLEMDHRDTAVAWLPLYHDMGLIGFVIATILSGMTSVFIPTMRFIRRPKVWMDAITKHKGCVSFAPNFAYALLNKKAKEEDFARWDLSSMRAFGCGAEPIQAETARAFIERFAAAKLDPKAFLPAYGMAEATLAMSFKPMSANFNTRVVDAETFQADGVVSEAIDGKPVFEHVSCGRTFPNHELAAFDENDRRLPDGVEGELCFKGASVTPGYFRNAEATEKAYRNGWLHTGDLGYVLDGEIYVTGRMKDLIILNGRNIHPQAIEWRAAEVENVRKGNVIAFSVPGKTSEELVVALETRSEDVDTIIAAVKRVVRHEIGVPPVDVVCLPPGSLPKTSSGKLQRRKARQQYMLAKLGSEGPRTMGSSGSTATVAKHVAKSLWSRAKNKLRGA